MGCCYGVMGWLLRRKRLSIHGGKGVFTGFRSGEKVWMGDRDRSIEPLSHFDPEPNDAPFARLERPIQLPLQERGAGLVGLRRKDGIHACLSGVGLILQSRTEIIDDDRALDGRGAHVVESQSKVHGIAGLRGIGRGYFDQPQLGLALLAPDRVHGV